jgi:hypothetical protein
MIMELADGMVFARGIFDSVVLVLSIIISLSDILVPRSVLHLKHTTGLDLINKLKRGWQIRQATEIKAVAPWRLSEERERLGLLVLNHVKQKSIVFSYPLAQRKKK